MPLIYRVILKFGCRNSLAALLIMTIGLTTSACISSTELVLSDANAILGEGGQLHLYDLKDGVAGNHRTYRFQWNGRSYVVRGRPTDVTEFTVHAYEGLNLIVQARARRPLRPYFYALARKLTDGVYLMAAINPDDADEPSRDRFCIKTRDAPCRIDSPEALFVFARATAARESEGGTLGVLVRTKQR